MEVRHGHLAPMHVNDDRTVSTYCPIVFHTQVMIVEQYSNEFVVLKVVKQRGYTSYASRYVFFNEDRLTLNDIINDRSIPLSGCDLSLMRFHSYHAVCEVIDENYYIVYI